jgi:hypothetical protein
MRKYSLLVLVVALTTSCTGDFKKTLGLRKPQPDEFTVISKEPLSLPPNFNLRAPEEGPVFRRTGESKDLFEADNKPSKTKVRQAAVELDESLIDGKNDATIKADLDKEYIATKAAGKSTADKKAYVNAANEKKRLSQNKKDGKAVNEGEVKTHNGEKSPLGKILGN